MKLITQFFLPFAFLISMASASTAQSQTNAAVDDKTVLVITAENMNPSSNVKDINDLMKGEVAQFSQALKKNLEVQGKMVILNEYKVATERDIALAIASMPSKPATLIQVYWIAKPGNALYITAEALKINYVEGTTTVRFSGISKKEYLSIGVAAKPSDTPENHAMAFSQILK